MPVRFKKGTPESEITSKPKIRKVLNDRAYIEEESIQGDFALMKARVADTAGNLQFYRMANNFNQDIAGNAKVVVAEVEEIVPEGTLDPD